MPARAYPEVFVNKDTYGIDTDKERDRIVELDANAKGELKEVLVGPRGVATRLCIAAIRDAEEAEDIARLVIGAIVDSSGVSAAAAKLTNPFRGDFPNVLKAWAIGRLYPEQAPSAPAAEATVPEGDTTQAAPTVASPGADPLPRECLPEWLSDIDFDEEKLLEAWEFDEIEISAYAGILAYCIAKQPDANNIEAFNQKRRNAVMQYLPSGQPKLFVDASPLLDLDVLGKIHRTFNSIMTDRICVFEAVIGKIDAIISGPSRIFYVMVRLASGASLNPLLIIAKFGRKYPDFYPQFPDIELEYHAAAHALNRFLDVKREKRMYMKLIYGSSYVPVDRRDVDNLLGVAVHALKQTEKTLANYNGGTLSVAHRDKLTLLMNITENQEEVVPEERLA